LGIIACRMFGDWASKILSAIVPELKELPFADTAISILGHIVLFIFVYINIALIATMIRGITNKLSLGVFDRVAGALLCVFKYLLALSLLLNLWFLLKPSSSIFSSSHILDGSLLKFVIDLAPWVINSKFIPASAEILNSVTT
jgi:colicin V production protein